MFEPVKIFDVTENGIRKVAVATCQSVCSSQIEIAINGDTVEKVQFIGGCHGNTQGVAALIAGMKVDEAIKRLEGIDCKGRGTSCPDQLARALKLTV